MDWSKHILSRDFYNKTPVEVAQRLLGKYLIRNIDGTSLVGKIVETEAYLPFDDPAAHNFKGQTNRNKSLYKDAGFAYVHSMRQYFLLDITTEGVGVPGSVLIRAVEPIEGIEAAENTTNGPGKVCRAFYITKILDGVDMTSQTSGLFVSEIEKEVAFDVIELSPRVGISKAKEAPLRFFLKNNVHVSKKRKNN